MRGMHFTENGVKYPHILTLPNMTYIILIIYRKIKQRKKSKKGKNADNTRRNEKKHTKTIRCP